MMRRHPERLVLAAAAVAWIWMIVHAATSSRMACCPTEPAWSEDVFAWLAMIVAMMVPSTASQMRDIGQRSYRVRRVRAVVAYALGYAACWLALGIAVCTARAWVAVPGATAFALFAAAWMLVPMRELWHARCHRRLPLYPVTWRADVSAFRHGVAHGAPCIALCWPLMIACTLTGHSLVVMLAGTALVVVEKRMRRLQRLPLVVGALAIAAVTYLV